MTRPLGDPPERLLAGDATDFERRVLLAAREKRPPAVTSARMARTLGLTAAGVGTAVTAKAVALEAAAAKTTAVAAATVSPWVSVTVVGLVVAGAVVGARAWHASHGAPAPVSAPARVPAVPAPAASAVPPEHGAERAETPPGPIPSSRRGRAPTPPADLREQIAFIDAARAAVSAGASARALEILRGYQSRYPTGSFRPEAVAIRIEALMKVGREAEARALAERFVAEHRGSLLARRVADIAGLTAP